MLAYCDRIADMISRAFNTEDSDFFSKIGNTKLDLHPEHGYFMTTKKTIDVVDFNGKTYRVTVEEVDG